MVLSLTCRFRVFVHPVAPERSQRYEKSSAEASVSLIMPRRSIFGEAKVRKVECRSKRQLDYAETKRKNNLRPLRRAGRSLRGRRPEICVLRSLRSADRTSQFASRYLGEIDHPACAHRTANSARRNTVLKVSLFGRSRRAAARSRPMRRAASSRLWRPTRPSPAAD